MIDAESQLWQLADIQRTVYKVKYMQSGDGLWLGGLPFVCHSQFGLSDNAHAADVHFMQGKLEAGSSAPCRRS